MIRSLIKGITRQPSEDVIKIPLHPKQSYSDFAAEEINRRVKAAEAMELKDFMPLELARFDLPARTTLSTNQLAQICLKAQTMDYDELAYAYPQHPLLFLIHVSDFVSMENPRFGIALGKLGAIEFTKQEQVKGDFIEYLRFAYESERASLNPLNKVTRVRMIVTKGRWRNQALMDEAIAY